MKSKWLIVGNSIYDDKNIQDVLPVEDSVDLLCDAVKIAYGESTEIIIKKNIGYTDFLSCITDFYSNINEDTIPFFYFCGHGFRMKDELYLTASDSKQDIIQQCAINYNFILEQIKQKTINYSAIILDCCYSGTANNLSLSEKTIDFSLPEVDYPNISCVTSCRGAEKAYLDKIEEKTFSIFTYHFSLFLKTGIDNNKSTVSLSEITDKVKTKIDFKQKPTIKSTGNLNVQGIIPNVFYTDKKTFVLAQDSEPEVLRVLLVKSAIKYPIKDDGDFGIPLGLWLLKSYIHRTTANIIVDIYDERLFNIQKNKPNFEDYIKDYDVVGASMCTCEVPPSLDKLRIAKENGKITFAGGIFTYSNEEYLLNYSFVDYVIPGVGTYPLGLLLKELQKRKVYHKKLDSENLGFFTFKNVFSKQNIKDASVWDAPSMPHIEYDVWDEILNIYGPFIQNKIDIFTSRGCNKNCSFCSVQRETKHNVIPCDQYHVVNTIKYLYDKGIRQFSIKDEDFFIYGKERAVEVLQPFKDFEEISFKIRARIDTMVSTGLTTDELAQYHIKEIQYGVESSSNKLRRYVNKSIGESAENVINLFNSHYESGIVVNASFILGLTGEDSDYYKSLKDFISKIYKPDMSKIYLNFYTPHPTKNIIPDNLTLVTNDLNYFTHKIPVGYMIATMHKIRHRRKMIQTYDEIVAMTKSQEFNPKIPENIKTLLCSDECLHTNNIMKYGE